MTLIKFLDDLLFGDGAQSAHSRRIHQWVRENLRPYRHIIKVTQLHLKLRAGLQKEK